MSAIPQQVLARQKAAVSTFVAAQTAVFGGFEKLIELNMNVVKATLDEVAQKSQQAADLKDAQDVSSFVAASAQPSTDKAMAYSKHVYDIFAGVQAELSKLAEAQVAEGREQVNAAIEQLTKNAPAGSESAVAMLKSSLASATSAYDSLSKAAKQAAEAAESNLSAAAKATLKAANDVAEAAGKATTTSTRRRAA